MIPGTNARLRVAVLMGGSSSERSVSLSTGRQIVEALNTAHYQVTAVDTQDLLALRRPAAPQISAGVDTAAAPARLTEMEPGAASAAPDVVFVALHGPGGEDGTIQGVLEFLGLKYTGSGVLASALAMNKAVSKRVLAAAGAPVAKHLLVERQCRPGDAPLAERARVELGGFPVFVKPVSEGSTFGCTLVQTGDELETAVDRALTFGGAALVEPYLDGVEITVGVLGNTGGPLEALPVVEIVPAGEYYDFESKYAPGGSEHIIPARLPQTVIAEAQRVALLCHEELGCRGMSRTDLIAVGDELFVLEVNTIPGMTPTSLLPQAAAHAGIPFPTLLDRIIRCALCEV